MRALGGLLVAALVVSLLGACTPDVGVEPDEAATVVLTRDQLETAGIAVVEAETDVTDVPTVLTMTAVQADRLVAEANAGTGVLGRDLDALAPVPAGMPPASYLLASYVSAGELPGAVVAQGLFRKGIDWTQAQDVVYPLAVIALLTADLMAAAVQDDAFLQEGQALGGDVAVALASFVVPAGAAAGPPMAAAGPCSAVTSFLSATIQGLFDVLRVIPGVIGAINGLGLFGSILSGIINGALSLAQGVVEGLVSVITGPVLEAMRIALGGLGVASLVLTYFSDERLVVRPGAGHTAFSIDPAPGNKGTFTASTRSLTSSWPPALVDCAQASGAKLPELVEAGDTASWALTTGTGLITLDADKTTVGSAKTAVVDFTTGHEDAETAKGPEVTQAARTTVTIPRKEVGDFLDLAANEVALVRASILAKVPGVLQGAAEAVLASTLDPIVASIRSSVQGAVGGILTLKGEGSVFVTFHTPKDPDPTAPPLPPGEAGAGDFCRQFDEQVDIAIAAFAEIGAVNVFGEEYFRWGGEFAAGLGTIDAAPPADLAADFATTTAFYEIVGVSDLAHAEELAQFVQSNDIDGARNRLWEACGAATFGEGM